MLFDTYCGDCRSIIPKLADESINMVFTSPNPFHTLNEGIGSEVIHILYIENLVKLFELIKPKLKRDGNVWVHMGDTHDDTGCFDFIPERFAIAMMEEGWLLRSKLIWNRQDRFSTDNRRLVRDWEYVYHFSMTSGNYFRDIDIRPSVISDPYHAPNFNEFASGFSHKVMKEVISLSCPPEGIVLDPLAGTGETGIAAISVNRKCLLMEINYAKYELMTKRLSDYCDKIHA
jgi:DNA modification methylase